MTMGASLTLYSLRNGPAAIAILERAKLQVDHRAPAIEADLAHPASELRHG